MPFIARSPSTGKSSRGARDVRDALDVRETLRRALLFGLVLLCVVPGVAPPALHADEAILSPPGEAVRVPLLLRRLQTTHRVLYVTAHPDDEDAGLIARLVHGEGIEVTLLTLTRGNGGQNEIGDELHAAIAALRTAELESAHRWDGATQWFGSVDDFGYSFSVDETFARWAREPVLRELVGAIRLHRPTVIVTLPPGGEGGGQHHQASARLTEEARAIAASERWEELGSPHRTERLFSVVWGDAPAEHPCTVRLGTFDPLLGGSPAELGTRSRAMHKCQGMVRLEPPLPRRTTRLDLCFDAEFPRRPLDHPFEEIPDRFLDAPDGRSALGRAIDAFLAEHGPFASPAMLPGLAMIRAEIEAARAPDLPAPALDDLERTVEALALAAQGIRIDAVTSAPFTGPDDEALITIAAENRGPRPVVLELLVVAPGAAATPLTILVEDRILETVSLPRGLTPTLLSGAIEKEIPAALPTVRIEGRVVPVPTTADEALPFPEIVLEPFAVEGEWRDEVFPRLRRTNLRVVPDPSIRPARAIELAPRNPANLAATPVAHGEFLLSTRTAARVRVELQPTLDDWIVSPTSIDLETPGDGIEVVIPFTVHPPRDLGDGEAIVRCAVAARATRLDEDGRRGRMSRQGVRPIEYPHIRTTALAEEARVEIVSFPCKVRPRAIGYVAGVGDAIPWAMRSLGLDPEFLDAATLAEGDLSRFEVIVLGVRAYKVRDDLRAAHPRLLDWVAAGGTLVVQYHKFEFNAPDGTSPYVPYPGAAVGRGRVTDEEALVALQFPAHGLFHEPNAIGTRDWFGWVQERGLYFLDVRGGTPYVDLVSIADSFPYNAGIRGGALVEAEVGEGRWIYVGLGLWRQAPAGVPGAVRLLANLLAR